MENENSPTGSPAHQQRHNVLNQTSLKLSSMTVIAQGVEYAIVAMKHVQVSLWTANVMNTAHMI